MKIKVIHNDRTFHVPRIYFVLCQKVKRRPDFAELEEKHQTRTKEHIERVMEYSQRFRVLSRQFAEHDVDKLDPTSIIYIPDILACQKHKDKSILSEEEILLTELCAFIHVKSNPHHPEYWDSNLTYATYHSEDHPTDGSKMSDMAIMEMCCDWCAMSKELGGSPFDWFEENVGKKWSFTEDQCVSIRRKLETAWT